jgi:hypothetical protein
MTTSFTPRPAPRRARQYGLGLVRFLSGLALLVAIAAPVGGIAYAINGASQAHADVLTTVRVTDRAALSIPLGPSIEREKPVALAQQPGRNVPGTIRLDLPGAMPSPASLEAPLRTVTVRAPDSTIPEQLLSRGAAAMLWVCIGAGAWLLRGLLLSITDGNPLLPANARRIAGIAGLVIVAAAAGEFLPAMAGAMVLDRLGLGAGAPVAPLRAELGLFPILLGMVLLALAEAFRRGSELARDAEGLV